HRTNIHNAALDPFADHDLGGILHQKEWRARINREHAVEKFGCGVEQIAAIGQASGVDQNVYPTKPLVNGGNDAAHIVDISQIGCNHLDRNTSAFGDLFCDRLSLFDAAPDNGDTRRAGLREEPGNSRAKSLRATGDNDDLSFDPVHFTTSYPAAAITRCNSM